ncbi:hydrolase 1, exosortase A system-associated [Aquisalimonas sp.]|uniref:hydrolase 1, exosortase A system-associated n=1 Tax=unclassified Aquisalimonas TaxID=2644645 RepID=UPI0025C123D3|nr:hydrolase 1, exosortase A system-associated [Aquisalimonas sp.]
MVTDEHARVLDCGGDRLPAILHAPESVHARLGVVVVVGGPQYRVGSHRQFLLLARHLAAQGIPVLRFDYRGMGDAEGEYRGFEHAGPDVTVAVDELTAAYPDLDGVVLWGLCDAACVAIRHAPDDDRVTGVVLLNPWVRTEAGSARAVVRHYYRRRVLSPDFWRKLAKGGINPLRVVRGFLSLVRRSRGEASTPLSLPERMANDFARFRGRVLLILSGNDLTADEFRDTVAASSRWRELLARPGVSRVDLADANHTFSRQQWRDEVSRCTAEWIVEARAEQP